MTGEIGVGRPFVHLSGRYALERGSMAVVWPLAVHPFNKNEVIVWDLAHDPRVLHGMDADTARRRLFTRQSELPDGEQRLPIKTIHLNKSPMVFGDLRILGTAAERWSIDLALAQRHAEHAAAIGSTLDALWSDVFKRPVPALAPDVDEDLYGGFIGNEDRRTLQCLLELTPQQLASKVSARPPAFEDGRLEELLFRYRARNFASTLNADERSRWQQHCAERLLGTGDAVNHGLTLAGYFERIDALADAAVERGDERAQQLLEALVDYAEGIAPDA